MADLITSDSLQTAIPETHSMSNTSIKDLSDLIPEDERAEAESPDSTIQLAQKKGFFSPAAGMTCISLDSGGVIYAKIQVDPTGNRHILYCQRYENGSFSPQMQVSQANLLYAATQEFTAKNISIPLQKRDLSHFVSSATNDYFGKLCGTPVLNIVDILSALCKHLGNLPVTKEITGELTTQQLYDEVCHHMTRIPHFLYGTHKSYHALCDYGINYIAEQLEMKPKELIKKLAEHHLLYLPDSSKGYQAKVNIDGTGEWLYCILKIENLIKDNS